MTGEPALVAFSSYLSGRNQVLLAIAAEIVGHLDAGERGRASDLMWLWVIGAYEVVRTMCQAQGCFSLQFARVLSGLKVALERVRVPSTKMERVRYDRRERAVPVGSDREADRWDAAARELWVGDPADEVSARELLAAYVRVMGAVRAEDVLRGHADAYER